MVKKGKNPYINAHLTSISADDNVSLMPNILFAPVININSSRYLVCGFHNDTLTKQFYPLYIRSKPIPHDYGKHVLFLSSSNTLSYLVLIPLEPSRIIATKYILLNALKK